MRASITILPGDGVGPEVTNAARTVLEAVAHAGRHVFEFTTARIGGCAIEEFGEPLPAYTLERCRSADAILLGAVGGRAWSDPGARVRPEQGLLALRRELGLFANLRPVRVDPSLAEASPLRPELLEGVDILFVRELTGGIYFGEKRRQGNRAIDECTYSVPEVERIVRVAASMAAERGGRLTSVDKANVLETSRLWRETTERVVRDEWPGLELEHVLVDAMAMHLLTRPKDFDVVVTGNMFGDILTDEASALAGSIGLLPSASVGRDGAGLYEPIHGSAPDIAGRDLANPYGTILSAAMLLRHSLGLEAEARSIEVAVQAAISSGARTQDIARGDRSVTTRAATAAVVEELERRTVASSGRSTGSANQ